MRGTRALVLAVCVLGAAGGVVAVPSVGRQPAMGLQQPSASPIPQWRALDRLRFEENLGQMDASVHYIVRGGDTSIYLTNAEAVLSLRGPSQAAGGPKPATARVTFLGGTANPIVEGEEPLPGITNVLLGDPRDWRLGIRSFARVRYREVYPRIDVIFHGDRGQLEYDFLLAPGADPRVIRLGFAGARSVTLGGDGALVLGVTGGVLRQDPPTVYQWIADTRINVPGGYVVDDAGHVSLWLGAYDRSLPLVIDPIIDYSTYVGGEHSDLANAVAVDSTGSVYITGYTDSEMFPTRSAFDGTIGGGTCGFGFPCRDVFVTKLTPAGDDLVYSTYLGGNSDDMGRGIAVDANGNAYVTGNTASTNFPVKNAIQPTFGGGTCSEIGCVGDAFVTKLSRNGSSLVYSTYLGGGANDQGNGIAVDSSSRPHVVGFTSSPTFPTRNAFQPSLAGIRDGFVTKLSADGTSLAYSTFLGGTETGFDLREAANGVAVDSAGSAYVTGETTAQNFPTKNAFQDHCAGDCFRSDATVTKFRPSGRRIDYSTYLGGFTDEGSMGHDQGLGIAVSASGEAFVTGFTSSRDFPVTTGAFQESFAGGDDGVGGDAFVTRFSAAGSAVTYSTYLGGQHNDTGLGIAVDTSGNAHVAGYTNSDDFPKKKPLQSALLGDYDAFVTKLNAAGSGLRYSTYLGGAQGDIIEFTVATGIAVDTVGNAYVVGWTNTTDFPIQGGFQEVLQGEYDTFVTKILPA